MSNPFLHKMPVLVNFSDFFHKFPISIDTSYFAHPSRIIIEVCTMLNVMLIRMEINWNHRFSKTIGLLLKLMICLLYNRFSSSTENKTHWRRLLFQVCAIQTFISNDGDMKYKLGCVDQNVSTYTRSAPLSVTSFSLILTWSKSYNDVWIEM